MAIIILFSCTNENEYLDYALNLAGKNRIELEKVLRHYQDDPIKYQAAKFLIENMPYHHYYDGAELKKYYRYYEVVSGLGKEKAKRSIDSLKQTLGEIDLGKLKMKKDIENIGYAFLVTNIDKAFEAWHKYPWARSVNFNDFCEYVLPYRIGDEQPDVTWREILMKEYEPLLDSISRLPDADNLAMATTTLFRYLCNEDTMTYLPNALPTGPHIGSNSVKWRTGTCRDFTDIVLYVFRAAGIPCSMDYIVSGDYNGSHFWNCVKANDGAIWLDMASKTYKPATEFMDALGKVFRETYSINLNIVGKLHDDEETPSIFRNPTFVDATVDYAGKQLCDISVPKDRLFNITDKDNLFLCLAKGMDWQPIDVARIERGKVTYKNVKASAIFCVCRYDKGMAKECSSPFSVNKGGIISYLDGESKNKEDIIIYSKFALRDADDRYTKRMINGVFEGSNRRDFKDADILYTIKERPYRLINTVNLSENLRSYRYVRYKGGKDSYCNIAEVSFYENRKDTLPMKGKPFGAIGCEKVFDSDYYTSLECQEPSTGWVGLDMGDKHGIAKIVFSPRNADNYIRKGDIYELFCWSNEHWISCGTKVGESDSLIYNVPKNSLLYLKDYTRGNEERIFSNENGRQRFW